METKTCKVCERELPEVDFPMGRYGIRIGTCKECRTAALRQTKASRRTQMGGVKPLPFQIPDFDGKEPREVLQLMGRAKKWLESRGYVIQLSGEYHETKIRKLKFE